MFKIYEIRRGELVLVSCRNAVPTTKKIAEHLKEIAKKRIESLQDKEQKDDYEKRQLTFSDYVVNNDIRIIESEIKDFSDGEIKIKLNESVMGKDVFIVQNTLDPRNAEKTSHNIMELMLMIDAVKRSSAANVSVIIPYMSYCKQEKRSGRQPISAKAFIDMLQAMGAERLITMDLHAPATEGFASAKNFNIHNIYASAILKPYFLEELKFDGVFVAPDAGAGKMVSHYAKVSGKPMAFGYKYRNPDTMHEIEEQKLLGDVKDKDVAIVDDQSASSGTMLRMAKAAKDNGAKDVYCAVAHAMLLGDDAEVKYREAAETGMIKELVATNTLIQPDKFLERNSYLKILDALDIFAEFIFEIHVDGSTSQLYDPKLRESMFGKEHKTL